jgi:hypothetical protein
MRLKKLVTEGKTGIRAPAGARVSGSKRKAAVTLERSTVLPLHFDISDLNSVGSDLQRFMFGPIGNKLVNGNRQRQELFITKCNREEVNRLTALHVDVDASKRQRVEAPSFEDLEMMSDDDDEPASAGAAGAAAASAGAAPPS